MLKKDRAAWVNDVTLESLSTNASPKLPSDEFRCEPIHEILAQIIHSSVEIELGVFRPHCLDTSAAARNQAKVQVLETVVFVIVEARKEGALAHIAVVLPTAADGAGDGAGHVIDARRAVNLIEVDRRVYPCW